MPDTFYSTDHFNFVWDENKNAKNIRKHGISFDVARMYSTMSCALNISMSTIAIMNCVFSR